MDPATVGFKYKLLYKNGVTQIPNLQGGSEAAKIYNYGGFEVGGPSAGLYANKWMPSFSDTVAKVWGRHTAEGGDLLRVHPERPAGEQRHERNLHVQQRQPQHPRQRLCRHAGRAISTDSARIRLTASTTLPTIPMKGFVQDSWKVNKRLTRGTRSSPHPFHALGGQARLRILRLGQSVQHSLHAHPVLRIRLEQEEIPVFRWADSRRGRCSTSRDSAWHTTFSATATRSSAVGGACITTTRDSSPAGWMSPPACRPSR